MDHEDEGQDEAGQAEPHGDETGAEEVAVGDLGRHQAGHGDGRRDGRDVREEEDEEVRGQQGDAQADECRRPHQRHQDVGGGGRQPQAEGQAGEGGDHQQQPEIAGGQFEHGEGELLREAGDREDVDQHADHRDDHGDLGAAQGAQVGGARQQSGDVSQDPAQSAQGGQKPAPGSGEFAQDVEAEQQAGRLDRGAAGQVGLDQRPDQIDDCHEEVEVVEAGPPEALLRTQAVAQHVLGRGIEVLLHGPQVHREHQIEVVDQCREGGGDDDLAVGHAGQADDQEGGQSHHRRRHLPAGRGDGLDRAGEGGLESDPIHQRDRQRAGGGDVGHAGARDHAHHAAGENGHLGRSGAGPPPDPVGRAHDEVDAAGHLQGGGQQHEGEDRAGRQFGQTAQQAAEVGDRGVADQPFQREAAVIEQPVGHGLTEVAVEQTDDGDQAHDPAPLAQRGIETEQQQDRGDSHVHAVRQEGALRRQRPDLGDDVPDRTSRQQGQQQVRQASRHLGRACRQGEEDQRGGAADMQDLELARGQDEPDHLSGMGEHVEDAHDAQNSDDWGVAPVVGQRAGQPVGQRVHYRGLRSRGDGTRQCGPSGRTAAPVRPTAWVRRLRSDRRATRRVPSGSALRPYAPGSRRPGSPCRTAGRCPGTARPGPARPPRSRRWPS